MGVDRAYVGRGIGRRLTEAALLWAGGEKDIVMYTCANEKAVPFYEKMGMTAAADVMEYNRIGWTSFRVE